MSPLAPPTLVTAFHIKVLAALLMVADHLGLILEVQWLRIIGRFSYPLFVWLLVKGAKHTQNTRRYQQRLLLLAIISQPLYILFVERLLPLNPVFQLWIGLVLIRLMEQHKINFMLLVSIVGIAVLFFSYGYYGIGLVYLIAVYPSFSFNSFQLLSPQLNKILWVFAFTILHFYYASSHPLQIFAILFVFFLPSLSFVDLRGPKARFFYWFYPLHFVPLILLKNFYK